MTNLFSPITIGKLDLPHRLAMAPMTRSRAAEGGLATELMAEYYRQRAGAALIISEAIQPSVVGQGYIATPGLHSAEQTESWRAVTEGVHSAGGRIFAQLMHSGRIGHPALTGEVPVAPSAVASGETAYTAAGVLEHPTPRALSTDEVRVTIADFTAAARNAIDAGFDGVELHGANGYLIHQFLADNTNLRSDQYGGSETNRIRFAIEVVESVADAIGPERTGLRLSPGNPFNNVVEADPLPRYLTLVQTLNPELAYLHLVETRSRPVTEAIREAWSGALLLNPKSGTLPDIAGHASIDEARQALNAADVVTVGGLWLANPDLVERAKTGGPFNEPDPATFYGGDHRGYTDYPTLAS